MLDTMTFLSQDQWKLSHKLKDMNTVLSQYMPGARVEFMVDCSPTEEFCGKAIALALFVPAHIDVEQLFDSGVIIDDALLVVRELADGRFQVIKSVLGLTSTVDSLANIVWKRDEYKFEFKTVL